MNSRNVLSHFDPAEAAGGAFRAIDREFEATAVNGKLTLRFDPYRDAPIVSGIEVTPSVAIRTKAGDVRYVDPAGNVWSGDYNYSGGNSVVTYDAASWSKDPVLYRDGRGGSQPFSYRFVVPNGPYIVTLGRTGTFDIQVNGQKQPVGPETGAAERSISVNVSNGEILLQFEPLSPLAGINTIQVLQAQ